MNANDIKKNLPRHIGLVPDGNRRWAKQHGLPSLEGHRQGFNAGKKIIEHAYELGIKEFTAWAFSTENWNRSQIEIDYLMNLYEYWLEEFGKNFKGENLKIRVVGQLWRLPQSLQKAAQKAMEESAANNGMVFNMGLSYGGRDEIVQGIKKIVKNNISAEEITEQTVSESLWMPDIDMVIRTGGEKRLSGFLTWQSTYAELFFTDKYLPDFKPDDFDKIIAEYAQRERRFGK